MTTDRPRRRKRDRRPVLAEAKAVAQQRAIETADPVPMIELLEGAVERETGRGEAYVVTELGLLAIERLARRGWPRSAVYAALGVSRRAGLELFQRQPEALLAYERGEAAVDAAVREVLIDLGVCKKQIVPLLFFSKAMLGYREGELREGASTTNVVVVPIQLPAPAASVAEYLEGLPSAPRPALPAGDHDEEPTDG